jgi:hypothetical protein
MGRLSHGDLAKPSSERVWVPLKPKDNRYAHDTLLSGCPTVEQSTEHLMQSTNTPHADHTYINICIYYMCLIHRARGNQALPWQGRPGATRPSPGRAVTAAWQVSCTASLCLQGFLWIPMDSCGFLWIPMDSQDSYVFLWIPMDS